MTPSPPTATTSPPAPSHDAHQGHPPTTCKDIAALTPTHTTPTTPPERALQAAAAARHASQKFHSRATYGNPYGWIWEFARAFPLAVAIFILQTTVIGVAFSAAHAYATSHNMGMVVLFLTPLREMSTHLTGQLGSIRSYVALYVNLRLQKFSHQIPPSEHVFLRRIDSDMQSFIYDGLSSAASMARKPFDIAFDLMALVTLLKNGGNTFLIFAIIFTQFMILDVLKRPKFLFPHIEEVRDKHNTANSDHMMEVGLTTFVSYQQKAVENLEHRINSRKLHWNYVLTSSALSVIQQGAALLIAYLTRNSPIDAVLRASFATTIRNTIYFTWINLTEVRRFFTKTERLEEQLRVCHVQEELVEAPLPEVITLSEASIQISPGLVLHVPPIPRLGKRVIITGSTGNGKSTLLDALRGVFGSDVGFAPFAPSLVFCHQNLRHYATCFKMGEWFPNRELGADVLRGVRLEHLIPTPESMIALRDAATAERRKWSKKSAPPPPVPSLAEVWARASIDAVRELSLAYWRHAVHVFLKMLDGEYKSVDVVSAEKSRADQVQDPWMSIYHRATNMSGGECTRLALAVCVYRVLEGGGNMMLMLDEPEQNLDTRTAVEIVRWMHALLGDRTLVVVSHSTSVGAALAWDMHVRMRRVELEAEGRVDGKSCAEACTVLTSSVSVLKSESDRASMVELMRGDV